MSLSATQLAVAFAAGVVSIISPCVWPLVPGYLSLVSGVPARELEDRRAKVVGAATGFVAGIWLSTALAATRPLRAHWETVTRASGLVLVFVGVLLATGQLAEISARLGS